jgi:hypothetical protein
MQLFMHNSISSVCFDFYVEFSGIAAAFLRLAGDKAEQIPPAQ